ncbi:hypothetical protein QH494_03405 [Sphingomonas sp. AR_OL41]|uniref:hypothetical protein n=1 Tax=Sphingomonas sp. AR_OL41 TaxID=3042729 RepID=UPI00247FDA0A|nr:hypothetical protein [Sphingomonas sp. AR_OL41]MDH7971217.1 hypothetical protein [Sphingomonas sp. AR_OL41]
MDLVERYLAAVRRNLPPAKADDIVAELRDDLCSRQEDREAVLERALTKDEISLLIKEFGHPLVVASRFRTHQYLVGPEVFPFYLFVMRIVLMTLVTVLLAVGVGRALFGSEGMMQAWMQSMMGIWPAVLITSAIITIIFAVLERAGFPAAHLVGWVPDQLPELSDKQPGPWESAIEVALGCAFLLWWSGVLRLPNIGANPEFRIEPSPVLAQLYWPIFALAAVRLIHNLIQWLRPRWKLLRGSLSAGTAVLGLAILALMYRAGSWVTVMPLHMPAAQAARLQDSLNLSLKIAIVVAAVVWTVQCLSELWRIARSRSGER